VFIDDEPIWNLFIKIARKKIRIVGSDSFHDITHRALPRREPLANLTHEKLETLVTKTSGRVLL
jgi:hypothetical protein